MTHPTPQNIRRVELPDGRTVEIVLALSGDVHKFSSTQIQLPSEHAARVLAMAHQIDDADLAEGGRETDPHVTVKYGLHTEDPADVSRMLSGTEPISFEIGKASLFPATEKRPSDVIKLDVHGLDLPKLNHRLSTLPNTSTHPGYTPHLTVAYVKPGMGKKYLSKMNGLAGTKVTASKVRFSSRNGLVTDLPVGTLALASDLFGQHSTGGTQGHLFSGGKSGGSDEDGVWRTIHGAKVFLRDGKITKGPHALEGKTLDEAHAHMAKQLEVGKVESQPASAGDESAAAWRKKQELIAQQKSERESKPNAVPASEPTAHKVNVGTKWTDSNGRDWEVYERKGNGSNMVRTVDKSRVGEMSTKDVRRQIDAQKLRESAKAAERFDADKAGVSNVKPGLFGQPTVDPIKGTTGTMFDNSLPSSGLTGVEAKIAKQYDPKHTPMLPGVQAAVDEAKSSAAMVAEAEGQDHQEPEAPEQDTPRESAIKETAKMMDSEYAYARPSTIGNVGEDLANSARHKRNAWRGLADAESNGTAAAMVTRDNLLKNEPHNLAESADKHPLTALAMHHAIRAFPNKPANSAKDRSDFHRAYQEYKAKAEHLAANEPSHERATQAMARHVGEAIKSLRGQKGDGFIEMMSAPDKYNKTANQLIKTYKTLNGASYKANSIAGKMKEFSAELGKKYVPAGTIPADATSIVQNMTAKLPGHIKDIIGGKSLPESLGMEKQDSGASANRFNPAEAYVAKATRTGGRDISMVASKPNEATQHLVNNFGMRGVQWGNSVSDEERQHHAGHVVGALTDLADVTGLKPQDISINGKLGLAIGARGHGTPSAHYEPGNKVINLTRAKGVGTLAHEWGHAFDHELGGGGITDHGDRLGGDYQSLQTSKNKMVQAGPGERGTGGKRNYKLDEKNNIVTQDMTKDPSWSAMEGVRQAMKSSGFKDRARSAANDYVKQGRMSSKKANDYWLANHEMFARSFEQHVQHKLHSAGRENTYLTGLSQGGGLWPTKEESAHMAPAFDKLFEAYRQKKYGQSEPMAFSSEDLREALALSSRTVELEDGRSIQIPLALSDEQLHLFHKTTVQGKLFTDGHWYTTKSGHHYFAQNAHKDASNASAKPAMERPALANVPASGVFSNGLDLTGRVHPDHLEAAKNHVADLRKQADGYERMSKQTSVSRHHGQKYKERAKAMRAKADEVERQIGEHQAKATATQPGNSIYDVMSRTGNPAPATPSPGAVAAVDEAKRSAAIRGWGSPSSAHTESATRATSKPEHREPINLAKPNATGQISRMYHDMGTGIGHYKNAKESGGYAQWMRKRDAVAAAKGINPETHEQPDLEPVNPYAATMEHGELPMMDQHNKWDTKLETPKGVIDMTTRKVRDGVYTHEAVASGKGELSVNTLVNTRSHGSLADAAAKHAHYVNEIHGLLVKKNEGVTVSGHIVPGSASGHTKPVEVVKPGDYSHLSGPDSYLGAHRPRARLR